MAHAFNPCTLEGEAKGISEFEVSLVHYSELQQSQGYIMTLSQKSKNKKITHTKNILGLSKKYGRDQSWSLLNDKRSFKTFHVLKVSPDLYE